MHFSPSIIVRHAEKTGSFCVFNASLWLYTELFIECYQANRILDLLPLGRPCGTFP